MKSIVGLGNGRLYVAVDDLVENIAKD